MSSFQIDLAGLDVGADDLAAVADVVDAVALDDGRGADALRSGQSLTWPAASLWKDVCQRNLPSASSKHMMMPWSIGFWPLAIDVASGRAASGCWCR